MSRMQRGLITGWFLLALPCAGAWALDPRVEDGGSFFKPETVTQANREIKRIKDEIGKDFLVETFAEVPASLQDDFKRMNKDAFFKKWVTERARRLGPKGVYVLIVRNPRHLEVSWRRDDGTNINSSESKQLQDLLLKGFRQNQYDNTLMEAIRFFEARASSHAAESPSGTTPSNPTPGRVEPQNPTTPSGPRSSPIPGLPSPNTPFTRTGSNHSFSLAPLVCMGVGVLILVVLLRGVARGINNSRGGGLGGGFGGPTGGYYGGGGGGFGRGFLGGMLGGLFGGYAADRYLNRRNDENNSGGFFGNSTNSTSSSSDFGSAGSDFGSAGSDFNSGGSSSSSDFGSSSSSSDFGSSGSDFGGGGSSGGDFGSGGGDF